MSNFFKYTVFSVIGISIINIVSTLMEVSLINNSLNGRHSEVLFSSLANANDERVLTISILYMAIILVSYFVVARWFFIISKFNHSKNIEGLKFSPGSSVWWFFVPIASLFMPYKAIKESYQASFNENNWKSISIPSFFKIWWASFILGNIAGQIVSRMPDNSLGLVQASNYINIISDILVVISAYCLFKIFNVINQNQSDNFNI